MKSAAPFVAIVCGVFVALVVGIAAFGDRIGLGNLADGINDSLSSVTSLVLPEKEQTQPPVEAAKEETASKPDSALDTKEPQQTGQAEQTGSDAESAGSDLAPTFDIVRVEPDGNTLVAGRAQPGWTVELKNGSAILSKAVANTDGEWVMILNDPLGEGVSDLSLSAQSEDGGEAIASQSSVTVARSAEKDGELLVVETEPGKASKILASIAKPKAAEASTEAAEPAESSGETETASAETAGDASAQVVSLDNASVGAPVAEPSANAAPMQEGTNTKAGGSEPMAVASKDTGTDALVDATQDTSPAQTAVAQESASEQVVPAQAALEKPADDATAQSISIEAVEIEGDMLFVAGAAEPSGSMLRLYIDNGEVASARSGERGRFLFDNNVSLDAGSHVARVDLLDGSNGDVLTRAEVTFSKQAGGLQIVSAEGTLGDKVQRGVSASAESGAVETKKVIIRRGDNLWTIARRVYGAGIRYSTIYDTNNDQIRDPHWIYPGQVFELPKGQDGWDNNFDAVETPDLGQNVAPSADAVAG
ncbi:Nucleoid-associated protein YgaU, contains BON and LysM domains [Cohaesibacter marisflavi]|uniref:Nucleoid-associated protein YgaU, contains BON and LysM domains n=1 Tax=Cohaesibacter marisflavi TaxID=655353 RepID=A0A1I5FXW0_9HYPH|nr:LysM peptidoglycan-binding domain-containing protein [Cohaesibacter marisflavi]SFO28587.1 Nucleoid-associated protein YgaU, contains BON and LysM domains [Cohaesibacter marisflavi]